jgi:hypothetical protein
MLEEERFSSRLIVVKRGPLRSIRLARSLGFGRIPPDMLLPPAVTATFFGSTRSIDGLARYPS